MHRSVCRLIPAGHVLFVCLITQMNVARPVLLLGVRADPVHAQAAAVRRRRADPGAAGDRHPAWRAHFHLAAQCKSLGPVMTATLHATREQGVGLPVYGTQSQWRSCCDALPGKAGATSGVRHVCDCGLAVRHMPLQSCIGSRCFCLQQQTFAKLNRSLPLWSCCRPSSSRLHVQVATVFRQPYVCISPYLMHPLIGGWPSPECPAALLQCLHPRLLAYCTHTHTHMHPHAGVPLHMHRQAGHAAAAAQQHAARTHPGQGHRHTGVCAWLGGYKAGTVVACQAGLTPLHQVRANLSATQLVRCAVLWAPRRQRLLLYASVVPVCRKLA